MDKIDLVKHFKRFDGHGNGLIIKGRVRVGKTYFASLLIKELLKHGFAIVTNIRFENIVYDSYKNQLFYITDDKGFFEAYLKIKVNTPIVLAWDDIQASEGFKSTHIVTKSGDLLAQFLIFIGKLDTNYIYIAHQKYIPNTITEGFEPLFVYKLGRYDFWLGDELLLTSKEIRENCVWLPMPSQSNPLPILSKATATFTFRLDLPALYRYLSRYEIGEDLRRGVKEFLDNWETEGKYTDMKKLSYLDIYIALCMKKEKILSVGIKLDKLINPKIISDAREILRGMGYKLK